MAEEVPKGQAGSVSRLLEKTGLDWILYVFSRKSPCAPWKPTKTLEELRATFGKMRDESELEALVEESESLLEAANERSSHIEGKGTALLGFTGASLALSVSIVTSLLDPKRTTLPFVRVAGVSLFLAAAISFVFVVLLLLHLLDVIRYNRSGVDPQGLLDTSLVKPDRTVRRLAALYYAQDRNTHIANEKATYLGGAQLWFRNAILLLFALGAVLCLFGVLAPSAPESPTATTVTRPTAVPVRKPVATSPPTPIPSRPSPPAPSVRAKPPAPTPSPRRGP